MYARISTFTTGPDSDPHADLNATMMRVLENPGCRGLYFLNETAGGTTACITLWDSEDSLAASAPSEVATRSDLSAALHLTPVGVQEYEVTATTFMG